MEPIVGVSLSSGGASGLAHAGVLDVLAKEEIDVRCVAGTSAGALVGAAFAAGRLDGLRDALLSVTRRRVLRLFDPVWPRSGLLEGRRMEEFFRPFLGDRIEDLERPFAAVATDLHTGEEVVLREGSVSEAVRASAAVPGVFTPKVWQGRSLADGGLVNPIPVNVARSLGAELVIAVSVLPIPDGWWSDGRRHGWPSLRRGSAARIRAWRLARTNGHGDAADDDRDAKDSLVAEEELRLMQVLYRASATVQARIAANRLRDEVPDVMISVPLPDMGLFDLHRAVEAIQLGRAAAEAALPRIRACLARRSFRRWMNRWLETGSDAKLRCQPRVSETGT